MAAYGIVRFFPKLGSIMSKLLVTTYIFPPILLAIPSVIFFFIQNKIASGLSEGSVK